MPRLLLAAFCLLASTLACAESGSYPSPGSTPPTPSNAYGDCHNPEYIRCKAPCEEDYCITTVPKPPNGKCPDGSDPVPNASEMDLWRRNHHHVAWDYTSFPLDEAMAAACTPCGGASAPESVGRMDRLAIQRRHRYRDFWIQSSFGPGVFCNYDIHLELVPTQWDWQPMVNLFDPQQYGFAIYLMEHDFSRGESATDGVYHDPTSRRIQRLELRDAAGLQPDQHLATHAVLTTILGETFTFEVVRTQAAGDERRNGRLVRFADRNGNATVITYAHPADATDAALGGDRTRLWQMATVTDMYGLTATFRYLSTPVHGRWCVDRIGLPNGEHIDYSYGTSTPGWGWIGGALRRVDHPDGSASTFGVHANHDRLGGMILRYDDPVAGSGHGRKDVYLTSTTWTDPDTGVVQNTTPNLCTKIVNGGELAYLVWDEPTDAQIFYAYLGGGKLMRVRNDGARNPVEVSYATRFDLAQPGTTYDWEVYVRQENDGIQRTTKRVDHIGRSSSFRYDPTMRGLAGVTHQDGSEDQWEYNAFHQETKHIDRLGRITLQTYDARGNRLTRTVAAGTPVQATTSWSYNLRGQPLTRTDANGHVTDYGYDARGFLVSVTEPADRPGDARATRTWTYDAAGRLAASADASGRSTTYEYDARNRHVRTRYADGSYEEVVFGTGSIAGLPVSNRDRNGVLTTYGYDGALRRVRTTVADGTPVAVSEVCAYVPGTRVEASCLKAGELTERIFDHRTRPIAITTHPRVDRALTTTRVLDPAGRLLREVDAFGRATWYGHDAEDRVVRTVQETVPGGVPAGAVIGTLPRILAPNAPYLITESRFDAAGQLVGRTDGRGTVTSLVLDARGRTVIQVEADGTAIAARTEFTHDLVGNLVEVRHPRHFTEAGGFRMVATFTGRDLPATRTEAAGRAEAGTTTWSYTPTRQRASETDALGAITRFTYGVCCDRIVAIQDPVGALTTFTYDAVGNVTSVTDAIGDVTSRAYDARRRLATETNGAGETTTWVHDDDLDDGSGIDAAFAAHLGGLGFGAGADGSAVSRIDALGHARTELRDGLERTVRGIDANGNGPITVHDEVVPTTPGSPGALVATRVIDALGHQVSARRDAAGRVLATVDADGHLSTAAYDAAGNRVRSRDPNHTGDDCAFDARNRLTACTDARGDTTRTAYDAHSNPIATTDALGHVASAAFDARDRRTRAIDRLGATTSFAYDAVGSLVALMDAEGGLTSYAYDARRLLVAESFPPPTGGTRTHAYDAVRRLVARSNQAGVVTTYVHDRAGRVVSRRYPDGRHDRFAYDAVGRLTAGESGRYANATLREYDPAGRLTKESLVVPGNRVAGSTVRYDVHYGYDNADRVVLIAYPDGRQVTRSYTARDQLATIGYDGASVADRAYDAGGRLATTTYGNGVVETRTWRSDNLVERIAAPGVTDFRYAYDADKRKTTETDGVVPRLSQTFAYDAQDRLTGWTRGDGRAQGWNLAPVGDWTSTTIDGVLQARTHTPAHEVSSIDGTPLTHDADGNLTRDQAGRQFTWDPENRLAKTTAAGVVATYAYDALGRRVSRTVDGMTTTFVFAGAQEIHEVDTDDLVVDGPALDGEGGGTAARPLGGVLDGTGVIRIDFQPAGAATADGYVADTGAAYGPKAGGLTFGWRDGAHPHAVDADRVSLQQWDTTHAMQPAGGPTGTWEIALPDGSYPVVVIMGDAAHRDMTNDVDIEKKKGDDADPLDPDATPGYEQGDFDGYAVRAQVKDGRLTIAPRASSVNAKICFVEIGAVGGHVDGALQQRLDRLVQRMTWATASMAAAKRSRSHVFGAHVDEPLMTAEHHTRRFLHANHLLSVAALTDAGGAVVERYGYDATGGRSVLSADGATAFTASRHGNRRSFTGLREDPATGLLQAALRSYAPGLGRWIGRDPWMRDRRSGSGGVGFLGRPAALDGYRDGPNLYAAPFIPNHLDPTGEYRQQIPCPAGSGGRCGWIEIDVGADVRARVTKDPVDCCHCCADYGISQTMCTASGACYYDNGAVVFDRGQRHDPWDRSPGENNRPPGGGNWSGNPWYPYNDSGGTNGGTTSNPVPQDSYGDAPTDPKFVLFIVQVLCRDTGEKVFEFRYAHDNGRYKHNPGENWTW